jgi:hypothetical protein
MQGSILHVSAVRLPEDDHNNNNSINHNSSNTGTAGTVRLLDDYTPLQVHLHLRVCVCAHVCVYTCVRVCVCACVCVGGGGSYVCGRRYFCTLVYSMYYAIIKPFSMSHGAAGIIIVAIFFLSSARLAARHRRAPQLVHQNPCVLRAPGRFPFVFTDAITHAALIITSLHVFCRTFVRKAVCMYGAPNVYR